MPEQQNQQPSEILDEETDQDQPQAITESLGTGVKEMPGTAEGRRQMERAMAEYNAVDPTLTGGDIDAAWSQAENTGEETVGGTAPTPDQDIVDDLGKAVGTEMRDREDFYGNDKMAMRDDHRWELDPKSAEDYPEHNV